MEILAGRYQLEERLGSGGTAVVWRATDTALGVARAVKLLHVAHGPDRDALRARMKREARAMARVSHPHVVAVHDVGQEGDRDYIVMDLVDGPTLADLLEREGPMAPEQAVRVAVQVLDALAVAHDAGVVHRDVKPGNILLDRDGQAHLCDFGIALAEIDRERHTRTGTALGSLPYMAPEQRRDAREVGPAADLYAVGCTLYHALTCATPVDLYLAPGRSPRWAAVPEHLVPVLRRATAAEPGDRYPDARSMAHALLRAAPDDRDEVDVEPTWDAPPRRRWVTPALWVNVAVVVVAVAVSAFAVAELRQVVQALPDTPAPAEEAGPPFHLAGDYVGPWDGRQAAILVSLAGPDDALRGEVRLRLSDEGHERISAVTGRWDPRARALVLTESSGQPGSGTYEARFDDRGVLTGVFRAADTGTEVSFALVRQ